MISSQILQNTIDELHGITRVDFAVMDTEGNEVATTMQPDFYSSAGSRSVRRFSGGQSGCTGCAFFQDL